MTTDGLKENLEVDGKVLKLDGGNGFATLYTV